ncbi:unnamed protein product [Colias eurytheme]|nr:unnamed protein product [Colias eurytheme]
MEDKVRAQYGRGRGSAGAGTRRPHIDSAPPSVGVRRAARCAEPPASGRRPPPARRPPPTLTRRISRRRRQTRTTSFC